MNRKPFKYRVTAALQNLSELGRTSRAAIEEATDNSKTTVQAWFTVEPGTKVTPDLRLPDAHDLHQLAVNLPDVAEPLLGLVTDGTDFCVKRGSPCGGKSTLDEGTDALIGSIQQQAELLASWRKAVADRRLSTDEAAAIRHDVDKLVRDLAAFGKFVGKHTATTQ